MEEFELFQVDHIGQRAFLLGSLRLTRAAPFGARQRVAWLAPLSCMPLLQVVIVVSRIWFTTEAAQALELLDAGNESVLKEYSKQQQNQLRSLIALVMGDLSFGDRRKIITLITTDVHARDMVLKMIEDKVTSAQCFQWQSLLRYTLDDNVGCAMDICDAHFIHGLEYVGNCGCLVCELRVCGLCGVNAGLVLSWACGACVGLVWALCGIIGLQRACTRSASHRLFSCPPVVANRHHVLTICIFLRPLERLFVGHLHPNISGMLPPPPPYAIPISINRFLK